MIEHDVLVIGGGLAGMSVTPGSISSGRQTVTCSGGNPAGSAGVRQDQGRDRATFPDSSSTVRVTVVSVAGRKPRSSSSCSVVSSVQRSSVFVRSPSSSTTRGRVGRSVEKRTVTARGTRGSGLGVQLGALITGPGSEQPAARLNSESTGANERGFDTACILHAGVTAPAVHHNPLSVRGSVRGLGRPREMRHRSPPGHGVLAPAVAL